MEFFVNKPQQQVKIKNVQQGAQISQQVLRKEDLHRLLKN
ncbi:hypothetical protein N9414_24398 [Nodularia spumigena CCY9414]|nr:hypothetical protein N9414_24398 [Nodularia spumigena CCY9414]